MSFGTKILNLLTIIKFQKTNFVTKIKGMNFKKKLTLVFSFLAVVFIHITASSQIESMRPRSMDDSSSFNIPSIPNSPNETFEFINPKNEEKKFEQTLNRIMLEQIANQESKDLQNKGIFDKQKFHQQRVQVEMDAITNKLPIIDKDLGGFYTNSETIIIMCRDFGAADEDLVSIILNKETTVRQIELTNQYQKFTIYLNKGANTVEFKALNQGFAGPNTASFILFDNKAKVISANKWNLATGAIASFNMFYEPLK